MTKELLSNLSLFLHSKSNLSDNQIDKIKYLYKKYGRDGVESFLRNEKSNVPFASLLLSELEIDQAYWKSVHQTYIDRNVKILELLQKVFATYYRRGGKSLCVVENFGSVLSSGISLGCFASNDVDLTADFDEKPFLIEAFAEEGFTLNQRGAHPIDNKQISTFYNPDALVGKGYWLNVMWTPVSRAYLLPQRKIGKRLHEERTLHTECYRDSEIRLLNPTAQVYFSAIHMSSEHFFTASPGISLQCDIDRVVVNRYVDWDKIARWSKDDQQGCRISMGVDICHECLGTVIPLEKFDRSGSTYKRLKSQLFVGDGVLNCQMGKLKRLYVEIASDDKPILYALISRIWRR